MKLALRLMLLAALLAKMAPPLLADSSSPPTTGLPPLGTLAAGSFDTVDLANLDVQFAIPILTKPGIGLPFTFNQNYNSEFWVPTTTSAGTSWMPATNTPFGWPLTDAPIVGKVYYSNYTSVWSCNGYKDTVTLSGFYFADPSGSSHPFAGSVIKIIVTDPNCGSNSTTPITNSPALDNSGYILTTDGDSSTVVRGDGVQFYVGPYGGGYWYSTVTDPNGNRIYVSNDPQNGYQSVSDTLNTNEMGIYWGASNHTISYVYTAPNYQTVYITASYVQYTVQTNFGVTGIGEYPATPAYLLDKITLPDGSFYHFTYEPTYGYSGSTTARLASITLPTGGTITYGYGGTNSMMADGSPSTMTRTIGKGTWTYQRQLRGGDSQQTWTTVTDPAGNITDAYFSGSLVTAQSIYQGNRQRNLDYSYVCYNGNTIDCANAKVDLSKYVSERDVYHMPDNGSLTAITKYQYDQYGNLTYESDGDLGPGGGRVLRQTTTVFDSGLCASHNQCGKPDSVTVTDGSGTQQAATKYGYDGIGNVLSVSRWVVVGTYLTTSYSYNGNGALRSETDVNGTTTTYTYSSDLCGRHGNTCSCNGAFPTTVSVPSQFVGTLRTSYSYDCQGGVVTSVTDPNGATTTTSYSNPQPDPYVWRPSSSTDALNNTTYYNYYGVSNFSAGSAMGVGQVEVGMIWNSGTSARDTVTTHDALGRVSLVQTRQAPRGQPHGDLFDTIETDFDAWGNPSQVSQPFACGLGQGLASCSAPVTLTTYDPLNRPIVTTDPAGGTTAYSYNLNDVKITVSGSQAFNKQVERDALGRLTSVCEMSTSLLGVGDCGQQTHPQGYLTSYQYDALGNLIGVTQGTETRAYVYDGVSRLTSETNPENVGTAYAYDSDPLGTCTGTFAGDRVRRTDILSNNTCYTWDGLHRVTAVTYKGPGGNAAYTQNRYFTYDVAQPGQGITATNPGGRLVFAYTCCVTGGAGWGSWSGFGYDKRGSATDFYQAASNGQGPYHTVNTEAPTGAVLSRTGYFWDAVNGRNAGQFANLLSYSFDGEGRPIGLTDQTTGDKIWDPRYTTYSPAGQPNQLIFSSGDEEQFTWDPNTGRMTQWQSILLQGREQFGTLTWNTNGTLGQLQIHDDVNGGNNQTCGYGYDDLARLASVDCGSSTWQQNFTYDQWGNITKSVPHGSQGTSFPATYNVFTNRFENLVNEGIVTYDGNGDVTRDSDGNRFTYDAEARQVKVNGFATVFDAFDRAVAIQNPIGVSFSQIVYTPDGYKFAIINGKSVGKYTAPLAAGVQAVYAGNSPARVAYWRHVDWLGSSRLALTSGGTVYYDGAYAPFGENYAEIGTWDRSFTGQQQDTRPGLYDFPDRQQTSVEGRWLVPDPAGTAAVDIANPQTWDRYAYVGNSPLTNVDSLGLFLDDWDWSWGWGLDGAGWPYEWWGDFIFFLPVYDPGGGGGGSNGGGSGGGTGGGNQNPPPTIVNYPVETNGIPNGLNLNWGGIWGALLPIGNCADAGPCGAIAALDEGSNLKTSVHVLLPGYNYCGPGAKGGKPKNRVDRSCKRHDRCYMRAGISTLGNLANILTPVLTPAQEAAKAECDAELCSDLQDNESLTPRETIESLAVGVVFGCYPRSPL